MSDEPVTVKALAKLIRNARDLQKTYFKTRTQAALEASKLAERELDATVAEILDPPTLFGRER